MDQMVHPGDRPTPKLLDRVRHEIRARPGNILKNPRSARPLKKVQMQGGA